MLRARRLGQLDDGTAQGLLELMRELLSHASAGPKVLRTFLANPSNVDALLDMVESTDTFTTVATLQVRSPNFAFILKEGSHRCIPYLASIIPLMSLPHPSYGKPGRTSCSRDWTNGIRSRLARTVTTGHGAPDRLSK